MTHLLSLDINKSYNLQIDAFFVLLYFLEFQMCADNIFLSNINAKEVANTLLLIGLRAVEMFVQFVASLRANISRNGRGYTYSSDVMRRTKWDVEINRTSELLFGQYACIRKHYVPQTVLSYRNQKDPFLPRYKEISPCSTLVYVF